MKSSAPSALRRPGQTQDRANEPAAQRSSWWPLFPAGPVHCDHVGPDHGRLSCWSGWPGRSRRFTAGLGHDGRGHGSGVALWQDHRMATTDLEGLASQIAGAVAAGTLDQLGALFAADVHWGAPDDSPEWGCHNRAEALAWYKGALGRGRRVAVPARSGDGSDPRYLRDPSRRPRAARWRRHDGGRGRAVAGPPRAGRPGRRDLRVRHTSRRCRACRARRPAAPSSE